MVAFVVRTSDKAGNPIPGVFEELKKGRARIGRSSSEYQDLRVIEIAIETAHTEYCKLDEDYLAGIICLPFLRYVNINDHLIYPNQPQNRSFTVVQVTGDYDYSEQRNGINCDFRSYRPCKILTNSGIDNCDESVPAQLIRCLDKEGVIWRVHNQNAFDNFIADLLQVG